MSDFLNENEENKYMIHVGKAEDAMVNLHVQEGNIEAKLTDGGSTNVIKKSTESTRVVQFHIPASTPAPKAGSEVSREEGLLNPLALSYDFQVYHISISSTSAAKAASYSITYSSGKREFFLQDGLIVDYTLQPKQPHSFFYCNSNNKNHIYYTLST